MGWPLGFWAAELTHPWVEFTDARYGITIASLKALDGGFGEALKSSETSLFQPLSSAFEAYRAILIRPSFKNRQDEGEAVERI